MVDAADNIFTNRKRGIQTKQPKPKMKLLSTQGFQLKLSAALPTRSK